MRRTILALAFAGATALLSACGGGGGGGDPAAVQTPAPQTPAPGAPGTQTPPAPASSTLTGVAATGRPFAGALVSVYDSTGGLAGTTTVKVDGSYELTIPATTAGPLVLEAVRDDDTLVSMNPDASSARVNITPLTKLIAARLATGGDPLALRSNPAVITRDAVQARVAEVRAVLQPLLAAVGDAVDPLNGEFSANGTGHDKVLDSVEVQIRPAGGVSNIELTVRGADTEDRTSFTSADAALKPLPAISANDLPIDNTAGLLDDLMKRLTACFALPLQERVNGATSNTGAATGTAADVKAPACRTLFLGDDPATFLSNGARVGRDPSGNGAFSSLFRSGATGVVFENANLEFLRNNPARDMVFTYRSRDTSGNLFPDQLIARNVGGTLKLVGNDYIYAARVRPFTQDREFVNQRAADYQSVGYNINIPNQVDGNGNPVFARVLVTAPNGITSTFRPLPGRASLAVVKEDGTLALTNVIRLAARFKNPSTSGNPAQFETGLYIVSPQFTDAQLSQIPEKGVWQVEFVHADASRPNVVQSYRTVQRAPTLAELSQIAFASLTPDARSELVARSAQFGSVAFGQPSASTPNVIDLRTAGNGDFWTLPAGAVPVSSVQISGRGPDPDGNGPQQGVFFDDGAAVAPSARTARVLCSVQSSGDNHCDSSTGVLQYAAGSQYNVIELFASSARLVDLDKLVALYYLLPR